MDYNCILELENQRRDFVSVQCPSCGQWFKLKAEDLKSLDITSSELDYTSIIMFNCQNIECGDTIGIKYEYQYDIFSGEVFNCNYDVLFPKKVRDRIVIPSYVNAKIKNDYENVLKLLDISPDASIVFGRKTLERIILSKWPEVVTAGKDGKFPTLAMMIGYLENKKLYEDTSILSDLKNIGNNATHVTDIEKDVSFTKADAEVVVSMIEILIRELFVEPEEKNMLRNKLRNLKEHTTIEKKEQEKKTLSKG